VNFTLPYKGSITSNWNLNYTVSGQVVTAWGVGYNNVLQPGQVSNSIGFCASR
jgi:endoglucanase